MLTEEDLQKIREIIEDVTNRLLENGKIAEYNKTIIEENIMLKEEQKINDEKLEKVRQMFVEYDNITKYYDKTRVLKRGD